jgi:regulator of sigma E protease
MDFIYSALNAIYIAGAVILLFGAAVFVHEFGHFWVARKCGMKVEAFAIGFGPKIFSWVKDGIEYSWRWIPAGGFVKLPQMVTSEALEGANKDGVPLPPAPPLSRILTAVAGPAMNMIFAFVLATIIYFVGLPVLVNPSIIGYVEPGSAEAKLGIQPGDRIVEINGSPTRTWQAVSENTALARTNILPVVIERNGVRTTYQLEAKASELIGLKVLNLDPQEHPTVNSVQEKGAAAAAGVLPNDTLLSFSGVPLFGRDQLIKLVQKRANEPTELVVARGPNKEKKTFMVTPRKDGETYRIGIQFGNESRYEVQKPGPPPTEQIRDVWNRTIGTFSALAHSKETGVSAKDLSGPIGIFAMLGVHVKIDYRLALSFLVLLNINLAILNMMPLPVLDGGHIVMAFFEAIFRRPVPVKLQEYATTVFAVLLISFMVYVSYHDLGRLPLFKTMMKQENHVDERSPESSIPTLSNPVAAESN